MGTENRTDDFIVDSEGHCFLCLKQISSQFPGIQDEPDSMPISCSIHSLQYLFRYLGMDMGGQWKPKVALCTECATLTDKCSMVYQQLEKLQMYLESYVSLIHGKLQRKEECGRFTNEEFDREDGQLLGKLETLKGLRREVKHKCYQKLLSCRPRVIVPNLSGKLKPTESNSLTSSNASKSPETINKMTIIKVESLSMMDQEIEYDIDNEDSFLRNVDARDPLATTMETESETVHGGLQVSADDKLSVVDGMVMIETVPNIANYYGSSQNLRSSESEGGSTLHPKIEISATSLQYQLTATATNSSELEQTSPSNTASRCMKCDKTFTTKYSLKMHRRKNICSRSYRQPRELNFYCSTCGKGFNKIQDLRRHFKSVHLKLREHACDLCDYKASRKDYLIVHRRKMHLGLKGTKD